MRGKRWLLRNPKESRIIQKACTIASDSHIYFAELEMHKWKINYIKETCLTD